MKISVNWLKEFVDFQLSAVELAAILTNLGLEVEGIEYLGKGLENVVIGQLLQVEPHPNADKLTYCKVDVGTEQLDIVCGAKNHRVGDKVPVALVGASLPSGVTIKRAAIRGLESCGMLCSAQELALAEDRSGIYILPADAPLGNKLANYLHLEDIILEVSLTPNRGDCLSMLGIAREVAAYCELPLRLPASDILENGSPVNNEAAVAVNAPELCLRYTARVIKNVTIKDSPNWLKARLRAVGLRPINNVVDATNYVLMELGHPLHAFDYDHLAGHKIIVKQAAAGEKFITLDGTERVLEADSLMICDSEKPVALAGIMGGQNSEVSAATKNLLLESACFKPQNIHHTSKRLQLETEATYRFTRGTDIDGLILALDRVTSLIQQLAGGEVSVGIIDEYPKKIALVKINLRSARVNAILGTKIETDQIQNILKRLHFKVENTAADFQVLVPAFRADITREIDLIEEIARLYGYNNIPTEPISGKTILVKEGRQPALRRLKETVRHYGLDEIISYSFIENRNLEQLNLPPTHPLRQVVPLANPLTEKQSIMRPSLVPGILTTLRYNEFQQNKHSKIFEIGKVFSLAKDSRLSSEALQLAGVLTGIRENDALYSSARKVDFYDLKAIVETLIEKLDVGAPQFVAGGCDVYYHPGIAALVKVQGEVVGQMGELHPTVKTNFELKEAVFLFELQVDKLLNSTKRPKKYKAFSRFPAVNRDLALVVPEEKTAAEITDIIGNKGGKILEAIELFDIYRGKPIPAAHKSLAFSLNFRSEEGTLTDEEVNEKMQKIITALEKQAGAEVRK